MIVYKGYRSLFRQLKALISFPLGADITPTWGFLLYTHIHIDRSLWRQNLTTHSMRLEAWVLLLLTPIYIALNHTAAALLIVFILILIGNSWIWSVDMKSPQKRLFCTNTLLHQGRGDVNTNKWCPAPSAIKCIDWSCSILLLTRPRKTEEETDSCSGVRQFSVSGRWREAIKALAPMRERYQWELR